MCVMCYSKGKGYDGGTLAELSEELAVTEWRSVEDGNSGIPEFKAVAFSRIVLSYLHHFPNCPH